MKAYIVFYTNFSRAEIQSWHKTKVGTLVLKTLLLSPAWISLHRMMPVFLTELSMLAFPSLYPSDHHTLRPLLTGIPCMDREALDIHRNHILKQHRI